MKSEPFTLHLSATSAHRATKFFDARLLSDMPNIRRAQVAMRQRPSFIATDPQRAQ